MATKLQKYQKMRDFGDTPEPSGKSSRKNPAKTLIFVVQKHHASHLHYDFRLEMEGVLKSWAVPRGPSYDPGTKRLAMMTEDHPYEYASFEGVIPSGNYGAGNVIIWDEGTWEFIEPGDDPVAALEKGKLTFRLKGKKLIGEWALVQLRGRSQRGNEWLLLKHRDQYASAKFDVTTEMPLSVISKKSVDEIGSERTWKSNREAAPRKARTVADSLREKKSSTPRRKASSNPESSSQPSRRSSTKASTPRSGSSRS
ncbi:MAG: DNA polymerase ligase N-terminal domain-containing protein [Acidobacteriota bacterium]